MSEFVGQCCAVGCSFAQMQSRLQQLSHVADLNPQLEVPSPAASRDPMSLPATKKGSEQTQNACAQLMAHASVPSVTLKVSGRSSTFHMLLVRTMLS